jgi:signal transduction histidine kinase
MALQRRRLADTHVLDHRTRRTLHDQVLPDLHAVVLQISATQGSDPALHDAVDALTRIHHQISDLIRVGPGLFAPSPGQKDLFVALRYMVETEFSAEFAQISWRVSGRSPDLDPLVAEVLFHAVREVVRNAAIHAGGETPEQPVCLAVDMESDDRLRIVVQDDGVGFSHNSWSSSERDGSLIGETQGGLALHSTMIAVVGGSLTVIADTDGTRVDIVVPAPPRRPG